MADFFRSHGQWGNLPYTINQGLNWLDETEIGYAQIMVISDQQQSNWNIQEKSQLLKDINARIEAKEGLWKLHFLKLQAADLNNFSVICKSYREEKVAFPLPFP